MDISRILRKPPKYIIDGKVVLVTGALTAVGRQLSQKLVSMGAKVALVDGISDGSGELFSQQLNKTAPDSSIYIQTDLRNQHEIRMMIEMAVLTFGHLDVLVNNAERHAKELTGEEDAQRICDSIDVNLRAPIVATWVFARYLRQAEREGVAVNVTAMAGLLPGRGREVYGAANAGLIHFTEASRALAPQLRVCALAPYHMDTPAISSGQQRLLPGQRLGSLLKLTTSQVVRSVVRCIEDSSLSGHTLVIAGESSYTSSYLLARLRMVLIMALSLLVLIVQRVFGQRVAQGLRRASTLVGEAVHTRKHEISVEHVDDTLSDEDVWTNATDKIFSE
ncbi:hypothetical protein LPJ78_001296 [Coemansia sp. RSA 989]|nr:hypothetical protein BX667DRAFT_495719 [Coemansia mojavensis]KAJ1744022.1 hypothetical protein LPJ68_000406 [Coemansia sp. RSA 1086]KAJ1753492.1 hypothetical protein LPJ79_000351 [Coemansia sp. RSA 1821]KAJ1867083.1 hypothetical protein LPJ78_001296 [Coemansia sp. RSA 989]KAJ1875274.1 hypothetical protein LPJ55_000803 [Coemansia sp. RSA 990]KAJ2627394.1 hypothetical protein H4R22_004423 [Coemansia sp. RSA 1290]KAJ2651670.1 hypothetical protein IWW40_001570 [Coemansia sp. RSA 1250]KAJ26766